MANFKVSSFELNTSNAADLNWYIKQTFPVIAMKTFGNGIMKK